MNFRYQLSFIHPCRLDAVHKIRSFVENIKKINMPLMFIILFK